MHKGDLNDDIDTLPVVSISWIITENIRLLRNNDDLVEKIHLEAEKVREEEIRIAKERESFMGDLNVELPYQKISILPRTDPEEQIWIGDTVHNVGWWRVNKFNIAIDKGPNKWHRFWMKLLLDWTYIEDVKE